MTVSRYDAVVIGGGANGLVAAATLGRGGRRVLVIERAGQLGGQLRSVSIAPGFRAPLKADGGWLPPIIARDLALSIPQSQPDRSITVAHDGGFIAIPRDLQRAGEVIRQHSTRDAERWAPFVERLSKLSGFLGDLYQAPPPDVEGASLGDLATMVGIGRRFRALGRTDMTELLRVVPMAVQDLLDDELECEPIKAAVGAAGIRDIRQGPRSGGTSFVLLHYLVGAARGSVRERGWWTNTADDFITAAAALGRRHGVATRTNTEVAHLLVNDDAVTGVVLTNGEEIPVPLVISTTDPARTMRLLDPVWLDPDLLHAIGNIKYRGCTAVVQYALDALPEVRGLGSAELAGVVSLSNSLSALERAYDAAKYGLTSVEPHLEISVPSLRWPSLAPAGKHVLIARVQYVPHLPNDGPWTAQRANVLGDTVTSAIARAIPRFRDYVLQRNVLTPSDLEAQFGLTDGALTHGELTLDQILFMRPVAGLARYEMPVAGLYLGGAGAHPGPGVLGGPGWLAARAALSTRVKTS